MTTPRTLVQFVNIGSGQLISSRFEIGQARDIAVVFPTIDSCAAFLLGAPNASAPFVRMQLPPPNSGQAQMFPGAGSMAIAIKKAVLPMPYGKIELTASQSAVRSLTVISRF